MKTLTEADSELVDRLFSNSIYENRHLGWLDLWDLPEIGKNVFLDESSSNKLLSFQPIAQDKLWLHTFLSDHDPSGYDLRLAIKQCEIADKTDIYTISSHNWYNALLIKNGFVKCDEIILLETDSIKLPEEHSHIPVTDFDTGQLENIYRFCESSFPTLWHQIPAEFIAAVKDNNYRKVVCKNGNIVGYLLADISEEDCHISRIAVNQSCQKRGIASALLAGMIKDCTDRGISCFSVNTNAKNKPALSLYHSLNLKQTGKNYPVYYKYF